MWHLLYAGLPEDYLERGGMLDVLRRAVERVQVVREALLAMGVAPPPLDPERHAPMRFSDEEQDRWHYPRCLPAEVAPVPIPLYPAWYARTCFHDT